MTSITAKDFLKSKSNNNRRSKFNAKKVSIDGNNFDSKLEADRYLELKLLEKQGVISELVFHKKYPLYVNNILICSYEADFVYKSNGKEIVEDTKGFLTKEYKIKKKLMSAVYGIDIVEVYAKNKRKGV